MKTVTLLARDANDLITTVTTENAKSMAEAVALAKRLSGGRKVACKGISTYVVGPRGAAWIA